MTDTIDPRFRLLIDATRVLATVCDNAAEVLSEEFKDMVTGPLAAVQTALSNTNTAAKPRAKPCAEARPWSSRKALPARVASGCF